MSQEVAVPLENLDLNHNQSHKFHIVQIGCGIVGSAYAYAYKMIGCDVSIIETSAQLVEKYRHDFKTYHTMDRMNNIIDVDFIMICVCTPLKEGKLDMSYIWSTLKTVTTILQENKTATVIIRSTVEPGITKAYTKILKTTLGRQVDVLFQPEFLRARTALDDATSPWQVVIGADKNYDSAKIIKLYLNFISRENIKITTIENAELVKLLHNGINAEKISYFNHFFLLCEELKKDMVRQNSDNKDKINNIDANDIIQIVTKTCEGLMNPKYGTYAGHAYYGSCLPKDSQELAYLEDKLNLPVKLFTNVVMVNKIMQKNDPREILTGEFNITPQKLQKINKIEEENHDAI